MRQKNDISLSNTPHRGMKWNLSKAGKEFNCLLNWISSQRLEVVAQLMTLNGRVWRSLANPFVKINVYINMNITAESVDIRRGKNTWDSCSETWCYFKDTDFENKRLSVLWHTISWRRFFVGELFHTRAASRSIYSCCIIYGWHISMWLLYRHVLAENIWDIARWMRSWVCTNGTKCMLWLFTLYF